jgi:hypothetical protein
MTAVATKVLVTEAMWNNEWDVTGVLVPSFATPKPFAINQLAVLDDADGQGLATALC